jgi:hypothetical protein
VISARLLDFARAAAAEFKRGEMVIALLFDIDLETERVSLCEVAAGQPYRRHRSYPNTSTDA